MYLLLDNSDKENICIYNWSDNNWSKNFYSSSEYGLVEAIDSFVKKEGRKVGDIEGLAVLVGKGSFTSTRIAITVVNTLAFVLNIPVVSVSSVLDTNIVQKIKDSTPGIFCTAVYSGEPNIGKKK